MKRKIIVAIAVVLMLGVAAYVISEQKMPAVSAASTPESTSVAAPASEANVAQGETNSEESTVDAGAQQVTENKSSSTTTIKSGPNKGQTIKSYTQAEWDKLSAAEQDAWCQESDPVAYEASAHAGETPQSFRERQEKRTTQEQLDRIDALLQ